MKKCHASHMKVTPKTIKLELVFGEEHMYRLKFVADKYTEGCIVELCRSFIAEQLKDFDAEIKEIKEIKEIIAGGEGGIPNKEAATV